MFKLKGKEAVLLCVPLCLMAKNFKRKKRRLEMHWLFI